MNLQQLRYVVATADEGTMTNAAARLHVAQPALSRAVRALEAEIDVAVFERDGRGVRVTRQGREVVALARRVLADVDRIAALGLSTALRVCAVTAQAREIASAAVARMVAAGGGRVSLDVVDTSDEVIDNVRAGSSHVGVVDLPVPTDLDAISLGWQEFVLVHPPDWTLPDPLDVKQLKDVPLVSPDEGSWRHRRLVDTLRSAGIEPTISADANDRELMLSLVRDGVGAWFSYGRQAADAVHRGAGLVHLDPPPMREVGLVHLGQLGPAGESFVSSARDVAGDVLIASGDPRLATASWVTDGGLMHSVPGTGVPDPQPPD
jgi:DNA-binding transcriptional LysR family regulator